jgi:protoporphyrinogen/coproporphyrinogen III oxidase
MHTICTFWNSSLFPGRAPEEHVLFTSFARNGSGAQANSSENWAAAVEAENQRTLGISGKPLERLCWEDPTALPQYNVGHARRVNEINAAVQLVPNLSLIGNFLHGRSIGDCVELAFSAAEDLHSRLANDHI